MTAHRKISNNTQSKIIIDLGDAKIELIQEYQKAMIAEAVLGKVKKIKTI